MQCDVIALGGKNDVIVTDSVKNSAATYFAAVTSLVVVVCDCADEITRVVLTSSSSADNTAASYINANYIRVRLYVCPSVCPSVCLSALRRAVRTDALPLITAPCLCFL